MDHLLRDQIPEPEITLTSKGLDATQTHIIESPEFPGIRVIHSNKEHGQDAFVIGEGSICICDGMTKHGKSGLVSEFVAAKVVEKVSEAESIYDAMSQHDFEEDLKDLSKTLEYEEFDSSGNRYVKKGEENSGYTTFLTLKTDKEKKLITWTSVGDSPLIILDKTDTGWSFEMYNTKSAGLTNETFASDDFHKQMQNGGSHGIGILENGSPEASAVNYVEYGTVTYKKGRIIMAATDWLTKMMADSPETIDARILDAEGDEKKKLEKSRDTILSAKNPLFGPKFQPELFFNGQLSDDEIVKNLISDDDVTMVCIDMDKMFKE
ncbi:MAG: hypothetical protein JWP09_423 [Candidatus Taylorbacteria bacterium]|nr:hypothetical protein [Candidatus Taylorbacteria bacterium]